jgi:protein-disulfide isomerase
MSTLKPPIGPHDHVQGSPRARIELVEYGDYQCPYCGEAQASVKAVQARLGKDLRFAFRNFPLTQVHPNALGAAHAAEAAALQGQFWEMHDLLYENQDRLEQPQLFEYAATLGLDLERFERDFASDATAAKVKADFLSGARSGVNGTPSFFVNGQRYDGSWAPDAFLQELELAASP